MVRILRGVDGVDGLKDSEKDDVKTGVRHSKLEKIMGEENEIIPVNVIFFVGPLFLRIQAVTDFRTFLCSY